MKKLLAITALLAASSTSVFAQTPATQEVSLSATVPAFCTIGGNNASSASVSGVITPTNGQVAAGTVGLNGTPGTVVCNSNIRVDLKSLNKGLTGPGTSSGSFTNKIHYTASASVNSQTSASFDTSSSGVSADTYVEGAAYGGGAFAGGTLTIAVNTLATDTNTYLNPGAYSDTLTVKLTPQ